MTYSRALLMTGYRMIVRRGSALEKSGCCDGRSKNNLSLLLLYFAGLAQVAVEEQEAVSSHHWLYF